MAATLHWIHQHGIVHLDLKPANIVVRGQSPVLIDFGSARPVGRRQPTGTMIGSPGYAAPELESGAPTAIAMDLFGLGAVLRESLTGVPAYDPAQSASERPDLPPLSRVLDGCRSARIAHELCAMVDRLLAPDPGDRPAAARDVLRALPIDRRPGRAPWPPFARPHLASAPSAGRVSPHPVRPAVHAHRPRILPGGLLLISGRWTCAKQVMPHGVGQPREPSRRPRPRGVRRGRGPGPCLGTGGIVSSSLDRTPLLRRRLSANRAVLQALPSRRAHRSRPVVCPESVVQLTVMGRGSRIGAVQKTIFVAHRVTDLARSPGFYGTLGYTEVGSVSFDDGFRLVTLKFPDEPAARSRWTHWLPPSRC